MNKEKEIYDYLCQNHVGKDNRITNYKLRELFDISDEKSLRNIIENIRINDEFKKIIASKAGKKGGYWIANSKSDCLETIEHLQKRALKILGTSEIINDKMRSIYGA